MKYIYKSFFQNRLLAVISLLAAAAEILFFFVEKEFFVQNLPYELIDFFIRIFSISLFVFSLFVSFEFFSVQKKVSLEEDISSFSYGLQKLFRRQFVCLASVYFAITAVGYITALAFYSAFGFFRAEYLCFFALVFVFNLFMPMVIAIPLGKLVSSVKRKMLGYVVLALTAVFFMHGGLAVMLGLLNKAGFKSELFSPLTVLDIFSPAMNLATNHIFGMSVLPYRFFTFAFWLSLLLLFIAVREFNLSVPKKSVAAVVLCLLTVGNYSLAVMPQSRYLYSNCLAYEDVVGEATNYYQNAEQKTQKAEFSVTDYNISLSAWLTLCADVTARVDNGELDEYIFTLYHTFKISEITNQNGEKLSFVQDGDYVTVKRGSAPLTSLNFSYKGNSPWYFANVQAMNLSAGFPFYPMPGYIKVYGTSLGFYTPTLGSPTDFSVKVSTLRKVYSNLDTVGKNEFSGKSNALTLVSGFLEEKECNGIRIIYPYLSSNTGRFAEDVKSAVENNALDESIKTVMFLEKGFIADGFAEANYHDDLVSDLKSARVAVDKRELYSVLPSVLSGALEAVMGEHYEDLHYQTFDIKLLEKAKEKYGNALLMMKCNKYFFDDSDTRTPDEFLADLCGGEQ